MSIGSVPTDSPDDSLEDKAARLRDAYRRRGPVESRLYDNAGQAAIVAERDEVIVDLLRSRPRPVRDLLDLGCGDGTVLAMLMARLGLKRAIGVDVLPERVDRARRAWPDLDVRVADASALPFPDESFDAVLAMTVFSSVPVELRRAIASEISRVLRPGGAFVWYDMRRRSPGNPDVSPFRRAEVAGLFPGWGLTSRSLTVAPPIARRLGRLTRLVYPVLGSLAILRTHEAGAAGHPESPPPDA